MKITIATLEAIANLRLKKEFETFNKIKYLHSNSIIYKSNINKLHIKLNCSRTKAARIRFIILKARWGEITPEGHLRLKTTKELHNLYSNKKYNYTCTIKTTDDINLNIIKEKIKQRYFISQIYSDLANKTKRLTPKKIKAMRKHIRGRNLIKGNELSHFTLSKALKCSKSSTHLIIEKLESQNKIKVVKQKLNFGKLYFNRFDSIKSETKFKHSYINSKGEVEVKLANQITILS